MAEVLTDCIIPTNSKMTNGYSRVWSKPLKKYLSAHRVSYEQNIGPIPEGYVVMHLCDNPPCTNPEHLSVGTQRDNLQDMHRKGRAAKVFGSARSNAKFTSEQVREIRKELTSGTTNKELAARYGVRTSTISNLWTGKTYKND